MNLARVRVDDAANDLSGDLLADDAPATGTLLNAAWRWLQGKAYTAGVETPIQEVVLSGLPARGSSDTQFQAYVTWLGCGDGLNQYEQPILPQDMIQPLSVWRRQSGQNGSFGLMTQATDGLPVWMDSNVYDWRQDGMYFYAASYAQDLRIRYAAFWPELDIKKPQTSVRMMMCEDCLSARIAFEYANLRGAAGAAGLSQMAEDAFATIAQRTSRRKQRATFTRIRYGGERGCGLGWPSVGGS